jgi:hexokinase
MPPSKTDIDFVRRVASLVTRRASAILAAGIHSLWQLRNDAEGIDPEDAPDMAISYNGSVLERYPLFKENCQRHLNGLIKESGGRTGALELIPAEESSLLGAAVSVACLEI